MNNCVASHRSAGFQTCCIADFQIGELHDVARGAGLETRDTADLEVGATVEAPRARCPISGLRLSSAAAHPKEQDSAGVSSARELSGLLRLRTAAVRQHSALRVVDAIRPSCCKLFHRTS
jgi:hypothetical protein